MKKLLVIPVMIMYLLAVTGIIIHTHYCGEELASWQMYVKDKKGCKDDVCKDEGNTEKGCCKDKVVMSKIGTDQNVVSFFNLKLASGEWILPSTPVINYAEQSISYTQPATFTGSPNAPPGRWQGIPLFKLHSRFTYYG